MRVSDIVAAYDAGQNKYTGWRKTPSQTTAAGIWFDLSMSTGQPVPNYYIGSIGTATRMARSTDGGLDHGPDVSPYMKFLNRILTIQVTATAVPMPMILCDYLMFYPFLSQDAGQFDMTNSVTIPRYTTGAGVQMMAVEVGAYVGGAQFYVLYTNSNGVSGRQSQTMTCNTQVVNGTIITSASATAGCAGPFIPLQAGDTGVRSIQSIVWLTSDVGLVTLVLVKPLLTFTVYDISAPTEVSTIINQGQPPVIKDDAYLNILCLPSGTVASSAFIGELETFWS